METLRPSGWLFLQGFVLTIAVAGSWKSSVRGQAAILINEVIAENSDRQPSDLGGGHPDMIELFNSGSETIDLGASVLEQERAYALSDSATYDPARAWHFPLFGSTMAPGGFTVVFCDDNIDEGDCELHASFRIENNGSEPVTLWGPEDTTGERPIVDQIWLPPMRNNHSFGRFPDGAGPAPVPLEDTFDVLRFFAPENTTFGTCVDEPTKPCTALRIRRSCGGAPNRSGDNLEPRVERESYSTSRPDADEPVNFTLRVEDDKEPTPGNIRFVWIRFSVNGEPQEPVAAEYRADLGVLDDADPVARAGDTEPPTPQPLDRWTLWEGAIPGLPAGSHVVFDFHVEDAEGLSSSNPRNPCADGIGPCNDVGLPGPNCHLQSDCVPTSVSGCKYKNCDVLREFLVGYEPPAPLAGVLINEIMPAQDDVLADRTQGPCAPEEPRCQFEDYIELVNVSGEVVDLSGVWLSDRPFHPTTGWPFPDGSIMDPEERWIVWADNDGGKCPRPGQDLMGDGQECPDPTNPALRQFHTNFRLEGNGDQVLLFVDTGNGFGVAHGVFYDEIAPNTAWSLTPDGTRGGEFRPLPGGSPGEVNPSADVAVFLRGDVNGDCTVDLSDAIFFLTRQFVNAKQTLACEDAADVDDSGDLVLTDAIFSLNFQFLGGSPPPSPGTTTPGFDPTEDSLGPCHAPNCS